MKIKELFLQNFRSYKEAITIEFDNLTAFVGKNDVGKSTILEALDIFFNDNSGTIKIDKDDLSVSSESSIITIGIIFSDYPEKLIIDDTVETSLKDEYLLNSKGLLEIHKKYKSGKCLETVIIANYPENEELKDIHKKSITELKKIAKDRNLTVEDNRKSSLLRKAIFKSISGIKLKLQEINVDEASSKQIWVKIQNYLPLYSLFQSDVTGKYKYSIFGK